MNELINLVEEWSKEKGLDTADSKAQYLKVAEETGEIAAALARSDEDELKDAIGDVVVTLIIISPAKRYKLVRVFRYGVQRD